MKYEWVCVGCERLIDGPDEQRVHESVEAHKRECAPFQVWRLANEPLHTGPVTGGFKVDREEPRE